MFPGFRALPESNGGGESMEGTVKWFNRKKGYGFIAGDDQKEYFVHFTGLTPNTFIRDNDKVSFDPAETDKGNQARNVVLLQKGSERMQEGEGSPMEQDAPVEQEAQSAEEETEEAPVEQEEEPEEKTE